jgi:hypothetical protein
MGQMIDNGQCNTFMKLLHHDLHLHFKKNYITSCNCVSKIYTLTSMTVACKCKSLVCK